MAALPKNVSVNTTLIDTLRGYTTAAYPLSALSPEATTLYNGGAANWIDPVDGTSGETLLGSRC